MKFSKLFACFYAIAFLGVFAMPVMAQVNLPHTLSFSSNSSATWADGIATDGDGGSQNINGLDLQIYASNATFTAVHPGATMVWHNNAYFSSGHADFTGLTAGPDLAVTMDGVPAMVIKSADPAINFSLTNIRLYDWGGHPDVRISTYNNGAFVGLVNVSFESAGWPTKTLTSAAGLPPGTFENIDEIRFTPFGGSVFWLGLNDIGLAAATVLPVTLSSFTATAQQGNSVLLNWSTQQELNSHHFDIEHSLDGLLFTKVGETNARGNSNLKTAYHFTIPSLTAGKHFFRLKQVDADGKSSYSPIISATTGTGTQLRLFPNPVKNVLNIAATDIVSQVKVYNASGSLVKLQLFTAAQVIVDVSTLPKGIYYADIVTDKETIRRQVIKQ